MRDLKIEESNKLAFLILIGGKSTRFGSEKSVIDLFGKPLILHQIETLSLIDQDIFLVAHSDKQVFEYRKLIDFPKNVTFILDDREIFNHPNIHKPTLGIYSGFKELMRLNFDKAFLLSCDMPLIKKEVIDLMISEIGLFDCVIPKWNNGFLEPFFAIYPVEKAFYKAKNILLTENYGILNMLDENWQINYVSVEKTLKQLDPKLLSLININGPIDIEKLIQIYEKYD